MTEKLTRIALGADHAGYHVKERVKEFLREAGYSVMDFGTGSEESVDYPDYARRVAESVAQKKHDLGILVCGTGIGMAMTANKVPGIRAASVIDPYTARLSREHNDANILALGARILDEPKALEIVRTWLQASFAGGRHQRRIDKISQLEREQTNLAPVRTTGPSRNS